MNSPTTTAPVAGGAAGEPEEPVVDLADSGSAGRTEPKLDTVRRHRSELRSAMASLKAALARSEDPTEWLDEVKPQIRWVRAAFERHVGVHERGPDPLHSEILRGQPHLAPLVNRLQRDHRRLEVTLDSLVQKAEAADDALIAEVKALSEDVIAQLARHRQRGADLVWEAFNHDLGGEN
jgi:hypothetical protein